MHVILGLGFMFTNLFYFTVKILSVALSVLMLSSCTSLKVPKQEYVRMTFPEPNRITFQGKGAGAGMALMGAMGPMGIALGVAIDEGIAKDLRKSASKGGFNIRQSVSIIIPKVTQGQWAAEFDQSLDSNLELRITKYGFKTTGGKDDATSAELSIQLLADGGQIKVIKYPSDFEDKTEIPSYPLDQLKSDGEAARTLLHNAFETALTEVYRVYENQ